MMVTTNLFTYGSLMFEPVWQRVALGKYESSMEQLEGFERCAVLGEDYPAVVRKKDATLSGRVYWQVDQQDMMRLDAFEGSDYERIETALPSGHLVALYLFRRIDLMLDTAWSPEAFLQEGMARFLSRYPGFVPGSDPSSLR